MAADSVDDSKIAQHPIDPALDPVHQHHHPHHNHTAFAEQDREDEIVYAKDTTFEKSVVPEPSPLNHKSSDNTDLEQSGESYPKRPWHRRVLKHWRHAAFAVIFCLFTG